MGHYYYCNIIQKNHNTSDATAYIYKPIKAFKCKIYTAAPLSVGDLFQDPQWMRETADSMEPYMY